MAKLLVVDPNPSLSRQLAEWVQRFDDQVLWVATGQEALEQISRATIDLLIVHSASPDPLLQAFTPVLRSSRTPLLLISGPCPLAQQVAWYQHGVAYYVVTPFHARELLSCIYALLRGQRRIVCLGGGTGLYTLLLGLKTLPYVHLTSIVGMSDDGGSAGRIREAFEVLPPGDVRRSLVALSTAPTLMNDVIQYRFSDGEGLKDHNLGNLLLTAMAKLRGTMAEAVRSMGDILNIQGLVIPVTTTMSTLVAHLADGTVVRGESSIDVPSGRDPTVRITRLWQEPDAVADPNALSAILAADVIVIGPGDLFTSVLATLTVKGIAEAIRAARAKTLYICNLMTKPGETSGLTAPEHVAEIIRYLEADVLDAVVISNSPLSPTSLQQYAANGQQPVRLNQPSELASVTKARVVLADIGLEQELVRHDSTKLATAIVNLLPNPSRIAPGQPASRMTT